MLLACPSMLLLRLDRQTGNATTLSRLGAEAVHNDPLKRLQGIARLITQLRQRGQFDRKGRRRRAPLNRRDAEVMVELIGLVHVPLNVGLELDAALRIAGQIDCSFDALWGAPLALDHPSSAALSTTKW